MLALALVIHYGFGVAVTPWWVAWGLIGIAYLIDAVIGLLVAGDIDTRRRIMYAVAGPLWPLAAIWFFLCFLELAAD